MTNGSTLFTRSFKVVAYPQPHLPLDSPVVAEDAILERGMGFEPTTFSLEN